MQKLNHKVSNNIIDFIDHCNGYANDRRRGFWLLDELYKSDSTHIKKAVEKCLRTLRRINKEGIDKKSAIFL